MAAGTIGAAKVEVSVSETPDTPFFKMGAPSTPQNYESQDSFKLN